MAVHDIEPVDGFVHWDFDRGREPALWIESGDVVRYRTLDASGFLEKRRPDGSTPQMDRKGAGPGHTLCGPVGIRGAKARTDARDRDPRRPSRGLGDGRAAAASRTPLNDRLGVSENGLMMIWTIDPDALTAVNQWGHIVALRPFMGVMGMPPDDPGPHPTGPPRFCGGNLDCKELVAGTKLYLPIPVDDALFSLGDGHGVQGDGEVSGMAIECPMERVEVKLTVLDEPKLTMPRAWTPEGWLTFGLHEELRRSGRDRDRSDARPDGRAPRPAARDGARSGEPLRGRPRHAARERRRRSTRRPPAPAPRAVKRRPSPAGSG